MTELNDDFTADVSADKFQAFIGPVAAIVDEARLQVTHDGLTIEAVDPANVAMVRSHLPAEAADAYDCTGSGEIGINARRLETLVGGTADTTITVTADAEFRKVSYHHKQFHFEDGWSNPDSMRQKPDIPDMNLPCRVELPGARIEWIVTTLDEVVGDDVVRFAYWPGDHLFRVEMEGKTETGHFEFGRDELLSVRAAEAESVFSIDYLKDMVGGVPAGADVQIRLGNSYPMKWQWDHNGVEGEYMVAPRVKG